MSNKKNVYAFVSCRGRYRVERISCICGTGYLVGKTVRKFLRVTLLQLGQFYRPHAQRLDRRIA